MCSFLLIFLLFAITFTFIHDSAQLKFGNLQTQGQTSEGICTQTVVLTQDRSDFINIIFTHQSQEHLIETSFKGSCSPQENCCKYFRQDDSGRSIPLGLPVRQTQQEVGQPVCSMLGSLVQRHKTRCYTKEAILCGKQSVERFLGWMETGLGRLGSGLGRRRECWRFFALLTGTSQPATRVLPEKSTIKRKKKGKVKGKGKGKGEQTANPFGAGKGGSAQLPAWPTWNNPEIGSSPFQSAQSSKNNTMQEMATHLRLAFKDQEAPADVQAFLEKAEKEYSRNNIKSLQAAT